MYEAIWWNEKYILCWNKIYVNITKFEFPGYIIYTLYVSFII